eukprot:CAMPEP_0185768412 /NCGR_PEP_ID=MMETSP1174-20130828/49520_1 /TAXON_ID=35687 /ORGANISM="Dictyocha speculum, Strain CCMP1381" /LENGTH=145 /DNA_ID=CAMNT_0028453083 /DNA_START=161 /DNA_END=598 /DNA_ORIENTATION=+
MLQTRKLNLGDEPAAKIAEKKLEDSPNSISVDFGAESSQDQVTNSQERNLSAREAGSSAMLEDKQIVASGRKRERSVDSADALLAESLGMIHLVDESASISNGSSRIVDDAAIISTGSSLVAANESQSQNDNISSCLSRISQIIG